MIFRIFPSKDNWITNLVAPFVNVPVTGSNFGASEILELFKKKGFTGAAGWAGSSSLGRILVQFDFSRWNQLTSSLEAPSSPAWRLVMRDARHAETLPSSYDVEVFAVSSSWDEGPGYDHETYVDKGQSNWVQSRTNTYWTSQGGDFLSSPVSVFHFDSGREDLDVDVGRHVSSWLSGSIPNNGLCVRMSSTIESNALDYYVKKFHSRQTNFLDRRPYLEARWDDSVRDDRNNFVYDFSGTLYLYNKVRGQLTNIPGVHLGRNCMNVRIVDVSGTVMSTSASWTGAPGVYSASFVLPSSSYSGSVFTDVWTSGSRTYMSGTFFPTDEFSRPSLSSVRFVATMPNLKTQYSVDESPTLRLYLREHDHNPYVVLTASVPSPTGLLVTRGYYRIDNDKTKEQVVPFGTGSYDGGVDWTRLSYDANGNYFRFHMVTLAPGNVYRIVFLIDQDGQRQIVDGGFKFKVT